MPTQPRIVSSKLEGYAGHHNDVRLNRTAGRIAAKDLLNGRQQEIRGERDQKLEAARNRRHFCGPQAGASSGTRLATERRGSAEITASRGVKDGARRLLTGGGRC